MATPGQKMIAHALRERRRPFFPGSSLNQVARQLVAAYPQFFRGMTANDARKSAAAALQEKLSSNELVSCRVGRGTNRKRGIRKTTENERELAEQRTARTTRRQRQPVRRQRHLLAQGRAAKQWVPQVA